MGKYDKEITSTTIGKYRGMDMAGKQGYLKELYDYDPDAYTEFADKAYEGYESLLEKSSEEKQSTLIEMKQLVPHKYQEVAGKTGQYFAEKDMSGWEKFAKGAAESKPVKAVEWWKEKVEVPLAAGAWSLGVQMQPGMQQGEEKLKDAGFWDWGSRVEGYREWDSPWGVKGLMEMGLDPTTYLGGWAVTGGGKALLQHGVKQGAKQIAKTTIDDAIEQGISRSAAIKLGEKASKEHLLNAASQGGVKGKLAGNLIKTGEAISNVEMLPARFISSTGRALTGNYGRGVLDLSDDAVVSLKSIVAKRQDEAAAAFQSGDRQVLAQAQKNLLDAQTSLRKVENGRTFSESLEGASKATAETEELYAEARAARLAKVRDALAEGDGKQAYIKAVKEMSGKMPRADFEPIGGNMTKQAIDDVFDVVLRHPALEGREFDKLTAGRGLIKILEGVVPQRGELKLLGEVFGDRLVGSMLVKRGTWSKASELALDIANFPRAVLASFDVSAPLRQGLFFQVGRFKESVGAYPAMFKALVREKNMIATHEAMEKGKWFGMAKEYGVHYSPMPMKGQTAALSEFEEAYMTRLASKIPGIKQSQRAYTTYLNKLRHDVFSTVAENWEKQGYKVTEKDYSDLARLVNIGTGRGRLPENLNNYGGFLSTVFFSPRLQTARMELPTLLLTTSPLVRKEFTRNGLSMLTAGASILTLVELSGVCTVEKDSRSSDFGKIKCGNTRFDIWGGNQQYMRLLANIISGEVKSSGGNIYEQGRKITAQRFGIGKFSPGLGVAVEWWTGETYMGDEYNPDAEYAGQKLIPMVIQDTIETWKEEGGYMAAVAYPLASLGMGVQSYGKGTYEEVDQLREKGLEEYNLIHGTDLTWKNTDRNIKDDIDNAPQLKELLDKLQNDENNFRGTKEEKLIKSITNRKQEEYKSDLEGLAAARRDNAISWKMYNEERSKLMAGRYSVSDMVREINSVYSDLTEEEVESKIRNNLSSHDLNMRDYKMIFGEPIRDQYGLPDWEQTNERADKFLASLNTDNRNYIKEHEDDWIDDLDPIARKIESERKVLIKLMEPYWDIKTSVLKSLTPSQRDYYILYQRLINAGGNNESISRSGYSKLVGFVSQLDKRIKMYRDKLRNQNAQIDGAVRVWY